MSARVFTVAAPWLTHAAAALIALTLTAGSPAITARMPAILRAFVVSRPNSLEALMLCPAMAFNSSCS